MSTPTVALIHGIDTPANYPMQERWGGFITPLFPDVQLREVWWGSTGTIMGDVRRIGLDKVFAGSALRRTSEALKHLEPGDGVVAHSMGTVWLLQLLEEEPERFRGIHIVLCGSPASNPVLRRALKVTGLLGGLFGSLKLGGRRVPHLWNRDDRVCALSQWADHPRYTDPVPVALGGRTTSEHSAEEYLGTRAASSFLRSAFFDDRAPADTFEA